METTRNSDFFSINFKACKKVQSSNSLVFKINLTATCRTGERVVDQMGRVY